jgi:hypothetical protein
MSLKSTIIILVLVAAVLTGCAQDKTGMGAFIGQKAQTKLNGGMLATFDVQGETYKIFITNKTTIEQILTLQKGSSQASIPNGKIVRGKEYNEPWNWHIDSEDIQMVEMTIEISDGRPSDVEADLDYWVDTVKRFSPWSAKLIKVEDLR